MPRLPSFALILLLTLAHVAFAQEPITIGGIADLKTQQWRVHCGDNPAFSAAEFDDSGWTVVDSKKVITCGHYEISWYRARVRIARGSNSVAMMINSSREGAWANYRLFLNGKDAGGVGSMPPDGIARFSADRLYPIPASMVSLGTVTIALRVWRFNELRAPGMPFYILGVGLPQVLKTYAENAALIHVWELFSKFGAGFMVGLLALGLFRAQPTHKEYLWLGLYGIPTAVSFIPFLVTFFGIDVPFVCQQFLAVSLDVLGMVFLLEFFFAFLGVRPGRWIRGYQISFVIPMLLVLAAAAGSNRVGLFLSCLASPRSNCLCGAPVQGASPT